MFKAVAQDGVARHGAQDPVFTLVKVIEALSGVRPVEETAACIRPTARQISGADGVTFVLRGETVFPLAEALRARGVPFAFATGCGV